MSTTLKLTELILTKRTDDYHVYLASDLGADEMLTVKLAHAKCMVALYSTLQVAISLLTPVLTMCWMVPSIISIIRSK